MYLIDTNIVSEMRKGEKADKGVSDFFKQSIKQQTPLYMSVVTIGELRRGVDLIRHRGDLRQADQLEQWLGMLLTDYGDFMLDINKEIAQLWGKLRVPHPQHPFDKLIAATAMIYDLTVVTRNQKDFVSTGVRLLNPFTS